ncbi:feline leukemia virus subgroup C receptor-related protein 1-like protein [Dinothrombium tinctorium]|uniref:Feline leukemia virus subgroup C receptor-related protein 1-like protein n=1 Tax=Dinothrombium tinctorium TaxID=1965070 RepID=A0A3S3S5Z2_9ACAR|nr:feline leukemia virus subgroup C receptor-related protein 1-like protein [Dinothrombium tinctorium]
MVPIMIPGTWILEKIGVRRYLLLGALCNFLGALLKCFSTRPSLFWMTLLGQFFAGLSAPFIQPLSPQVARTWFPREMVSRVTSIGVFSMFLGNTLGTIIPVALVPNVQNKSAIARGLTTMFAGQAIFATIQLVLVLVYFEEKPRTPPSKQEAKACIARKSESYLQSMKNVLNKDFILLLFVYAICGCESNSLLTLLNQLILTHFKNDVDLVSLTGFFVNATSIISTYSIGYIIDKKNCYKLLIFVNYGISCFLFFVISLSLWTTNAVLLVAVSATLGFTINSYPTIIFNFASELTYPEPEGVSSSLLVLSSQLASTAATFIVSSIIQYYGVFVANLCYSSLLAFAMFLTIFIKNNLRSQQTDINEEAPLLAG